MNKSMISGKSGKQVKNAKDFDAEAYVRPGVSIEDVREVKEVPES